MMPNKLTLDVLDVLYTKIREYEYEVVSDEMIVNVNFYITEVEFDMLTKILTRTKLGYLEYSVHKKCVFKLYTKYTSRYNNFELSIILRYSHDFKALVNVLGQHIVYDYIRIQKYKNVEIDVPTFNNILKLTFVDDCTGYPIKLASLTDSEPLKFFNKYTDDEKFITKYEIHKNILYLFLNQQVSYEFINIGKCLELFHEEKYYELLGEVSRTMYSVMYGWYKEKETKSSYLLAQS